MGQAVKMLEKNDRPTDSQRCVSFTETPLEHIGLMCETIEKRNCRFEPYGVAITKKQGRNLGCNPVWYLDITPGHDWLTKPFEQLIQAAIGRGPFEDDPVSKVAPFIEQMGAGAGRYGGGYRKEFWWEREWRANKDIELPCLGLIVICPESDFSFFSEVMKERPTCGRSAFVDTTWSLEQMIARLAGFERSDVGPV